MIRLAIRLALTGITAVAALLVLAMWIRSYGHRDCILRDGPGGRYEVSSNCGVVLLEWERESASVATMYDHFYYLSSPAWHYDAYGIARRRWMGIYVFKLRLVAQVPSDPPAHFVVISYWLIAAFPLAALLWIGLRRRTRKRTAGFQIGNAKRGQTPGRDKSLKHGAEGTESS